MKNQTRHHARVVYLYLLVHVLTVGVTRSAMMTITIPLIRIIILATVVHVIADHCITDTVTIALTLHVPFLTFTIVQWV